MKTLLYLFFLACLIPVFVLVRLFCRIAAGVVTQFKCLLFPHLRILGDAGIVRLRHPPSSRRNSK